MIDKNIPVGKRKRPHYPWECTKVGKNFTISRLIRGGHIYIWHPMFTQVIQTLSGTRPRCSLISLCPCLQKRDEALQRLVTRTGGSVLFYQYANGPQIGHGIFAAFLLASLYAMHSPCKALNFPYFPDISFSHITAPTSESEETLVSPCERQHEQRARIKHGVRKSGAECTSSSLNAWLLATDNRK